MIKPDGILGTLVPAATQGLTPAVARRLGSAPAGPEFRRVLRAYLPVDSAVTPACSNSLGQDSTSLRS